MPFENEHSCRLRDPEDFQEDSFKRRKQDHDGKEYSVIYGRLKENDKQEDQAYRYNKNTWSKASARNHCEEHDGSFEAAREDGEDKDQKRRSRMPAVDLEAAVFSPDVYWAVYPACFQKMLGLARHATVRSGNDRNAEMGIPGPASIEGSIDALMKAAISASDRPRVTAVESVQEAGEAGYPVKLVDDTAVISILGPIEKRMTFFSFLFGGTSIQVIQATLRIAAADDAVRRIVLRIDSPGGSVSGLSELGDTIDQEKEKKPIDAYIEGVGASAAYYLASHAQHIYAERTALVGSLGVILVMYDWSAFFEKAGIKPVVISTGPYKATGVEGTEITEEQQTELREIVDFYAAEFSSTVMTGRRMSRAQLKELFTGRVWDAPAARKLGLVDGIKPLEGLLASYRSRSKKLKAEVELAGIRG